jgi:hypothetical protein
MVRTQRKFIGRRLHRSGDGAEEGGVLQVFDVCW